MAAVRISSALVCCVAMSCGSLVDDRFVGQVRLQFSSNVSGDPAPFIPVKDKIWMSLFYARRAGNPRTVEEMLEHEATRVQLNPPASVNWAIYDAPEERHYISTPSGKRYALAIPLAYVDENEDGRWTEGEPLAGESPITAVVSIETALEREESPTGGPLEPGFYRISRPLWCAPRPVEPAPTSPDCGVRLSEPCTNDAECGAGATCLLTQPWPWPNGTCALPSTSACVPERAHVWRNHREPRNSYWLRECETTADCRDPYLCDRGYKVCLPTGNLGIRVAPNWMMGPVCQPPMMP